jgi:enamine deaminase RidA (YjgF/YER057c/UK114 family)
MVSPEEVLKSLNIVLPTPAKPLASYVPWVKTANLVYISGQLPFLDDQKLHPELLGSSTSVEDGKVRARQCAINIIAHLREACNGDLSKVKRIVKITGFVCATADFKDHPKVINGASDLLVEVFGEKGKHTRAAVGVASLPLGCAVEIEAIAEVE